MIGGDMICPLSPVPCHPSNSNRFSLANIRKIKRTILPEREVKDEGDEV